jgi:hypothetical protein
MFWHLREDHAPTVIALMDTPLGEFPDNVTKQIVDETVAKESAR